MAKNVLDFEKPIIELENKSKRCASTKVISTFPKKSEPSKKK
jgi:hypothetical protein